VSGCEIELLGDTLVMFMVARQNHFHDRIYVWGSHAQNILVNHVYNCKIEPLDDTSVIIAHIVSSHNHTFCLEYHAYSLVSIGNLMLTADC
jgi:hypothetical protein